VSPRFSGILATASRRPSRSPPKRRSASPAAGRDSPSGRTKASPARKPSPDRKNPSPVASKKNSPVRIVASPTRNQVSPKDKKRRDDGTVDTTFPDHPNAVVQYAAGLDHVDVTEASVATSEGSNAGLYGLFALIPVVGVAAVAAWRFSRKTPESVDFDKAADNA